MVKTLHATNRFIAITATLALVSAAGAVSALTVHPEAIALENKRDVQRVVIMSAGSHATTLDLTMQATVTVEPPELAKWENGRLHPLADGEGLVRVKHHDEEVTVPLKVTNATADPRMSFRNDVLPVLMRSGCNSGACHGSSRGKNGFGLSLFGFDPAADYMSLTREARGRRLSVAQPEQSLILTKPLGDVDHEGGIRFAKEDVEYGILKRWIAEGARNDGNDLPELTGIRVMPKVSVLERGAPQQRFSVLATYSDGTDRDVTDLAILSSTDESVVSVESDGLATAGRRGETTIMARYGAFTKVSQVITVGDVDPLESLPQPNNFIDDALLAKLERLRIPPGPVCDDETFVRRVYLDILGILPTPEQSRAFIEDTAENKREALVDRLLQEPEFNDVWAMKWAELLRVRSSDRLDPKGMHRYNDWLRTAITENKPVDELVTALLTAEGGNFTEPASNFYLVEQEPNLMAENVAQVFLGIQIKCAQCHNHPFDQWTMDDYYGFSAFFAQIGRKQSSDPRETIIFNSNNGDVRNIRDNHVAPPKFLGADLPADVKGRDRREVLAEWLVSADNPWFAKNVANRVWAHFMGRGIVDPVDDVRVSNPASHPDLLDTLGARLTESGYDLRALIRDICTSRAYQTETMRDAGEPAALRNFAYREVKRLPAEMLLDAICRVTDVPVKFAALPMGARAVEVADGAANNYFLDVFGRPSRETACTCERRDEPTLAQALHLLNGDTVTRALSEPNGRLKQRVSEGAAPESVIEELYLAAYARTPSQEELDHLTGMVTTAEHPEHVLEDIYWSVLNSKEFLFYH